MDEAIISYQRALRISESAEIKTGFAQCIRNLYFTHEIPGIRPLVARAISEPWGRPAELANPAISLIKLDPAIKPCIDRAQEAWPTRITRPGAVWQRRARCDLQGSLLRCLLENTPVCDLELERFLTMARSIMLRCRDVQDNPSGATSGPGHSFR